MLLLSFSLPSVTVAFIHPLMRPWVPPTFDEDNGLHILDIRFSYWIFTPLPPFKQASLSTAFHLLLLPTRLLGKLHNLNIAQPTRSTTTQNKTRRLRQLMPSMPSIFPFPGLSVILSTFQLFLSLQPSPMSSMLCIWWWRWCIMSIATWRWRFFEPFNFL